MQRAAFFDLDDTLHDRTASIGEFVISQARRLLAMRESDASRFAERFIQLEEHGRVWKDQVYQTLGQEFPQARDACDSLLRDYLCSFPKACRLRHGAADVLRNLRQNSFKRGIVTNGRSEMQLAVVRELKLKDLVDTVVISERVGLRKPDPRIFCHALIQVSVEARSAVFVGDDIHADISGALSAGFRHAYWFDTATTAAINLPPAVTRVGSFAQLAEKLYLF